jgi:hypothetical protein
VAHDQQRPLLAVAFQSGDQVGTLHVGADDLRWNAFLVEYLLHVLSDDVLVAGRIPRVETQHRLVVAHRLVLDCFPFRLLRRLSKDRHRGERDANRRQARSRHRASFQPDRIIVVFAGILSACVTRDRVLTFL